MELTHSKPKPAAEGKTKRSLTATESMPEEEPRVGVPLFLRGLTAGAKPGLNGVSFPGAVPGGSGRRRVSPPPAIQGKLAVAGRTSPLEEEADQIAHTASSTDAATGSAPAPPSEPSTQNRLTGTTGDPLSPDVRQRVEPILGADLSRVRVHHAAPDRAAAANIRARAFTHREHIFLGHGESAEDVGLVAHELAHVVQQTAGDGTPPVQRKPAAYQHPEDGAAPHRRLRQEIDEELGDSEPPAERPTIDRGDVSAKQSRLQPTAQPDVDRPAQERPGVEAAAAETDRKVDEPAEAEGEGEGGREGEGEESGGRGVVGEAEAVAAQAAFGEAAETPPTVPPAVAPIEQVVPVDAGGQPLEPVPGADEAVAEIAEATQSMRDEGTGLQETAAAERVNAGILEGNVNLIRQGIAQSDFGVATSQSHAVYRRTVVEQGRAALGVSREKTAWVAEQAPQYLEKADQGREDSEGMAEESSALSAESQANTPDDDEAAERANEQSGEINRAGRDVGSLDGAFSGSQQRSRGLSADAAQAAELNTQVETKIGESAEMLQRTEQKLGQMREQTDQARAQIDGLAGRPAEMIAQAEETEAEGRDVVEQSLAIEERLRTEQKTHRDNAAGIPEETPEERALREETGEGERGAEALPPIQPIPALPAFVAPEGGEGGGGGGALGERAKPEARGEGSADEAGAAADAQRQAASADGAEAQPIPVVPPGASMGGDGTTVVQRQPQAGYEDRLDVDLASPVAGAIPQWLGGAASGEGGQQGETRGQRELREQARREQEILDVQRMAGKPFEETTAWERRRMALRLMGRHLWSSLSGIRWPGWGTLALGLINPVTPLLGVVSGFGMIASGTANVFNVEAWRRDWLGNLLKVAADIATGLTIILGSITALAAVIAALCTALIIVSFGFLAPALGPAVAFCGSVMVTVGGWTIAVGKWALLLQFLSFLKNLYEAGVARNAADLQRTSDRMSSDVSAAGNVVLQMGMAKLAQVGGRGLQGSIARAGGGVRWAGGLTTRVGGALRGAGRSITRGGAFARLGAAARGGLPQVPGLLGRGVRGGARGLWRGVTSMPSQALGAARALPGALRSPIASLRRAFGSGLSRDFLIGADVPPGLPGLRAAASEGQALAELEAAGLGGFAGRQAVRLWGGDGIQQLLRDGLTGAEIRILSQVPEATLRRLVVQITSREMVNLATALGPTGLEAVAQLPPALLRRIVGAAQTNPTGLRALLSAYDTAHVAWALELPLADAQGLLGQITAQARAVITDITAVEARDLIAAVGINRVNNALSLGAAGPVRGSHLLTLHQRLAPASVADMLDSAGTAQGRLVRLARAAEGYDPAVAHLAATQVAADTLVLDSNARVAIDRLLHDVNSANAPIRFADLAPSHQTAINALRRARGLGAYVDPPGGARPALADIVGGGADLRLPPLVGAETIGGEVPRGYPSPLLPGRGQPSLVGGVRPNRAHPDYAGVVNDLGAGASPVGAGKGGIDRTIVADAMFADTAPGLTPRLVTVDEDVIMELARRYATPGPFAPVGPRATWLPQLRATFGSGQFQIMIRGRSGRGHRLVIVFEG